MRARLGKLASIAILTTGCASQSRVSPLPGDATVATAAYMESIRDDPAAILLFLRDMPKGGDLHNHLSGSIYAESFIAWAAEDGMCLTTATLAISDPPCTDGEVPAGNIPMNPALYGDVIDAWSMRNWNPARQNGHDQFFESFAKFGAGDQRLGDMLAEVVNRASAQHISYMELMFGPDRGRAIRMGRRLGPNVEFAAMRERLLAAGLRDSLQAARREIDQAEARQRSLMRCDAAAPRPGCNLVVRYLYQVLRGMPPESGGR